MKHRAYIPIVRQAAREDLDALVALENEAFQHDVISRRSFRRYLTSGSSRLLVAELPGQTVAGYILVHLPASRRGARIYSVAVAAFARGHGIGLHLLRAADDVAREAHRTEVTLEVRASDERTRGLYEFVGYREDRALPSYYEDGADGVRMVKHLGGQTSLHATPGRVPVVVVDERERSQDLETWGRVLSTAEYLALGVASPGRIVINLSSSYEHMARGYYVSLLAEARAERCFPGADNLLDINWKRIHRRALTELEPLLSGMDSLPDTALVFFGKVYSDGMRLEPLSVMGSSLFDRFRCPILKVTFRQRAHTLLDIEALGLHRLSSDERKLFAGALSRFLKSRDPLPAPMPRAAASIAMLVNPDEAVPPSDEKALQAFERAALDMGARITRIDRGDLHRLAQFDALFIRETTRLDHHTYRFARKAREEHIPVYDTPEAILKCTNKVYLFEMLRARGIPTPPTFVFDRRRLSELARTLTYPAVLKVPDSAFSLGVHLVASGDELRDRSRPLFRESDLLLVQSFVETRFDWRIGILDGKPLFACQYFMAEGHWQIMDHSGGEGAVRFGDSRTVTLSDTPSHVLHVARAATRSMGRGLFGVDVKETPTGALVIEVNDNPNIDAGVEDAVLGDALYTRVLRSLVGQGPDSGFSAHF
ncbi:MAG: alpha-L-glutamate ligase [Bacteroidetes bacterium CG12_big_fil_rev_8_21_14_0_65_60_17]|nr:MAG: alpha-L-glutamate ligase [Bacteroidetes bacterium CG12_big_fil_rev_8_21_14_0_65_60_17]